MIAHITKSGKEQSLQEHLEHVSTLCRRFAKPVGLSAMAELVGLLHDMGKGTQAFADYLRWQTEHEGEPLPKMLIHHNHAPTGAIYVYEHWFCGGNPVQQRTAQIIALCIYGHHTGLMDCVDRYGDCHFLDCMEQDKNKLSYQEAAAYFLQNIEGEAELGQLFTQACKEFKEKSAQLQLKAFPVKKEEQYSRRDFQLGMLTRLLLSMLVDADRWDSACFEYGRDALAQEKPEPDWTGLLERYEAYAKETFKGAGELDQKRQEISDLCAEKADGKAGIYRLSVPTGGGKTFASLRYALRHAKRNGQRRIFYVIPYNTILDQNARDIREALGEYDGILEHHSDFMLDDDTEKECLRYKQMTERWDSDIILTSMVQFLNALFRKENTNARRMHRLTDAVLIFDEIQALPRTCKGLFERAAIFLTTCCHATVLLCTATQMELDFLANPVELMGSDAELMALHTALKRVEYIPQIAPVRDNQQAAAGLFELLSEKSSVLMIVNTKAVAWDIFQKTCDLLKADGFGTIGIEAGCSVQEIQKRAGESGDFEILCVHLSTLLCPEHRKEYIRWVRNWTKGGGRALCVSTALIEAGINVSFPAVVRSLAGLPSIIQAAGRCNRNMEQELGDVYIWELSGEKLRMLPEIQQGKDISRGMMEAWGDKMWDNPEGIKEYFEKEQKYTDEKKMYPVGNKTGVTLVDLLSNNPKRGYYIHIPLKQSFREAGSAFEVIPQKTKPVLVPYGEGENLIVRLSGSHTMEEEIQLMRQAQQYSVNLYDNMYRRLAEDDALYPVGENGLIALKPEYYDTEQGVRPEQGELEMMIF